MTEARPNGRCGGVPVLLSLVGGAEIPVDEPVISDRGSDGRNDELLSTIESTVIPRLLLLHRANPVGDPALFADTRPPPTVDEIRAFADLCATNDLGSALHAVELYAAAGLSLESILLELVSEAARVLGTAWERDERSFSEVTAGLGVLQQVVHVLGPGFSGEVPTRGRVVLSAAPGEQHTLGLHVVGEFVRRAGWAVEIDPVCDEELLLDRLAAGPVDLLGFTISGVDRLPALEALIGRLRAASTSTELAVMVGGSIDLAPFAERLGVALCLTDAREAVDWLEDRLEERIERLP